MGEGGKRKASATEQQPKRAAPAHTTSSQKGTGKTPAQDAEDNGFPFPMNEVMELLEVWIQDDAIKLPPIRRPPTEKDMTDPKYCRYHRFVHHPTKDCNRLKQIFREKIEARELQLGNEGVHRDPLPIRSCMISGDFVLKTVQSMMERLCEILYFSKARRKDIFAALNRIVSGRRLYPEKEAVSEPQSFLKDASKGNWGLLTVTRLKDVEFDSTLIDIASEFNIITVKTLKAAKITKQEATRSPTVIKNPEGELGDAYGYIDLEVKLGDVLTQAKFYIVKEHPNYDMVLGGSWIHDNKEALGVCPLPVSIPKRFSNKPSGPEDCLLPYLQLEDVTQLPG